MHTQQEIIRLLKVKEQIKIEEEVRKRIDFIKTYLNKNEMITSIVLGISGGVDSTTAGKLCQLAVNELNNEQKVIQYQFIAVRLPYNEQKDEADAQKAISYINPSKVLTINIKNAVDSSVQSLKESGIELSDFLKGNEKARERMKVQYSIAGHYQGIVCGTDHASEAVTGFFTKYGDGACDIAPLYGLNKRQVRSIAEFLKCPIELSRKTPTADLEDNKPLLADEDSLQLSYDQIDDFLENKQIPKIKEQILKYHYLKTMHKRNLPITIYDK